MDNTMDLVNLLDKGVKRAQKGAELYERYTMYAKMPLSKSMFLRKVRLFSNEARKAGIRVVGDDNGYYIAETEEEWEHYTRRQKRMVGTILEGLAGGSNISFNLAVATLLRKEEKGVATESQLNLFQE